MILNGLHLIIAPNRPCTTDFLQHRPITWMLTAALTAATLPAAAMVAGHLGAGLMGHIDHDVAMQRALVSFVSIAVGVFVMTSGIALVLFRIGKNARCPLEDHQAIETTMRMIWPAWFCAVPAAFLPFLGSGPEMAEFLWIVMGTICAVRTIKPAATAAGVRRRWRNLFTRQSIAAFAAVFITIVVVPASIIRFLLGIASVIPFSDIPSTDWPVPPSPNW